MKPALSHNPYLRITRPFTLLMPFVGVVSAAAIAIGSRKLQGGVGFLEGLSLNGYHILLGGVVAALLNAASNIFNQATDIEVDRINKPDRVLPTGQISKQAGLVYSFLLYGVSLFAAYWIQPSPGILHTFWCVLFAAIATIAYSAKPVQLKARGWWSNITIALVRGCLIFVAGWGCVAGVLDPEPWFLGLVFMIFLVGATTLKDFSDIKGDRTHGIDTLAVRYGPARAARIIAPFCVIPWALLPVGAFATIPGAQRTFLVARPLPVLVLGAVLAAYGLFVARLLRNPDAVEIEGNHPSWKHMYLMIILAQVGLVVCYMI